MIYMEDSSGQSRFGIEWQAVRKLVQVIEPFKRVVDGWDKL